MSFASIAQRAFGQRPFYLYGFKRGTTEWRFTNKRDAITRSVPGFAGTVWSPSAVQHAKIPDSDQARRAEFPVVFPLSDAFARLFIGGLSFQETRFKLWKGFENDPDNELAVQFTGLIVGSRPDQEGTITLTCMTDIAYLQWKGLSAVMQRPCRHVLYGAGCKVNRADFLTTGNISAISADKRTITVPAGGALPATYFNGGVFEYAGHLEMIISHVGGTMTLAGPIPEAVIGQPAKLSPGCNLTTAFCRDRFSNLDNFGGFPFMTDVPFDGRSVI